MYQEVARDINTLLQLFSRAAAAADPALGRLRRMLAAALAGLRLRVVLCRWFLAQAQRPAQPRPEEQEVLLRLLMLHEMAQHGVDVGRQSPPTLARLASGGSGVSGSSPASPGGLPPAPSPQFLPSPRAASAAAVLLDPQEAAEVVEEELDALAERLAECGGEGCEEGLRAWAETVAVEAQALLSGAYKTPSDEIDQPTTHN